MRRSFNPLRSRIPTCAWLVTSLASVGALSACASDRTSEPPPATATMEPEQGTSGGDSAAHLPPATPESLEKDQQAIDQTANTSERLADRSAAQVDNASEHASVPGEPAGPQTDLERATKIRRALMSADGLSTGARNVNVAVEGGRVTLRGAVESPVEKTRVEETAKTAAGADSVVSELVVAQ